MNINITYFFATFSICLPWMLMLSFIYHYNQILFFLFKLFFFSMSRNGVWYFAGYDHYNGRRFSHIELTSTETSHILFCLLSINFNERCFCFIAIILEFYIMTRGKLTWISQSRCNRTLLQEVEFGFRSWIHDNVMK